MNPLPTTLANLWLNVGIHLWQTTLVLLLVLLLSRWIRFAPARIVQALWNVALLKVLLPVSLFADLAGRLAIVHPAARGAHGRGIGAVTLDAVHAVLQPEGLVEVLRRGFAGNLSVLPMLLTLLWAAGACVSITRLFRRRTAASGEEMVLLGLAGEGDRVKVERTLEGTDIPPDCIRVSRSGALPHVVGWFRPDIVIPASLIGRLERSELRAVLLHEDQHRRRRDPLRGAMLQVLCGFLFFYPLVRVLLRRLQDATELVCDERVVRSGVGGEAYARALAKTLQFGLFPTTQPFAAGVGGGSLLRVRFERISTPWRFSIMMRHRIIIGVVCLLVLACAFLPTPLVAGNSGNGDEKGKAASEPAKEYVPLDEMPVLVNQVPPVYPDQEKKDGVSGDVVLRLYVSEKGSVDSMFVSQGVTGHPAFDASAQTAARQWTFKPAKAAGKAAACWVQVPIRFRLDEGSKGDPKK